MRRGRAWPGSPISPPAPGRRRDPRRLAGRGPRRDSPPPGLGGGAAAGCRRRRRTASEQSRRRATGGGGRCAVSAASPPRCTLAAPRSPGGRLRAEPVARRQGGRARGRGLPLRHGADDPHVPSVLRAHLRRGRPRPRRLARPGPARPAVALLLRRRRHARPARPTSADGRALEAVRPGDAAAGYRRFMRALRAAARHLGPVLLLALDRRRCATRSTLGGGFKPAMLARRHGAAHREHRRRHRPRRSSPTPRVAQMLDHFTQYVGSAPDASPAVLCGIAHMQTGEGVWYPRGGTRAVPEALVRLAARAGRRASDRGTGVRRILTRGRGACAGVEHRRRASASPLAAVVSNTDAVRTHRELLGGTSRGAFAARRRLRAGLLRRRALPRASTAATSTCCITTSSSRATRTRSSTPIYRQRRAGARPDLLRLRSGAHRPGGRAAPGGEALYVLVHTPYLRPHHDWSVMLPRVPPDHPRQARAHRRARRPRRPHRLRALR